MKTPLIANELYAANDGTAAATIDLSYHLKKGAIAFYDYGGTLIPDTVTDPADIVGRTVNIVVGDGLGGVININDVTRTNFQATATPYIAAAKKKMTIGGDGTSYGLNLPNVIESGATAILHVYNTTQLNDSETYDLYVVDVDINDDELAIITKLIAAVNVDPKALVTASAADTDKGITFIAKDYINFAVTASGVIANADVLEYNLVNHAYVNYTNAAIVADFKVGNGTPEQVKVAEDYFFATRGDGNYNNAANDNLYTKNYIATAGTTYHQYNATYFEDPTNPNHHTDYVNDLTIYIDSSITALKTSLDAIFGAI